MDPLELRASRHRALGDPLRLGVVDELQRSDRTPRELANGFGIASNLLAHHLEVLQTVGLIERFVSSGDRRRRYVRLVMPAFADLGVALPRRPDRVTFVCTHNSARSQLAAALWTLRTGLEASSAGTEPAARVHPGAVAAGERRGLDLRKAVPRLLAEPDGLVVTVCDRAHETIAFDPDWWHWSIPDPVELGTAEAFDHVLLQLDERIASTAAD